jgi:hypothetical protein
MRRKDTLVDYSTDSPTPSLALADLQAQAERLGTLAEHTDPDLSRALATTARLVSFRAWRLSSEMLKASRQDAAA